MASTPTAPPALTDAAESETSERSLRAIVTCVGGSHFHPSREVAFACALLNERERHRHDSAADRRYMAEPEKDADALVDALDRIRDLERDFAQAKADAHIALHALRSPGFVLPHGTARRIESYAAEAAKAADGEEGDHG
jgi:hypothetical protein